MKPQHSRRDILRLASASIALGVSSGTALGRDGQTEPKSSPITTGDLKVRNQSPDAVTVSVRLFQTTDGDRSRPDSPAFSTVHRDLGRLGASPVAEDRLDLDGGTYDIEVSLGDGTTEQTTWAVPPGGVPDWLQFSVRILPTGEISMGTLEV